MGLKNNKTIYIERTLTFDEGTQSIDTTTEAIIIKEY